MREESNQYKVNDFVKTFPQFITLTTKVYFAGGATAVLKDIRKSTIDVDVKFEPEHNQIFSAIKTLKESLNMNIELASPFDFIPELPSWKERCEFIVTVKKVHYFHLDPYAQVIAKVLRGFDRDIIDAEGFYKVFNCKGDTLLKLFEKIKNEFIKRPSVDIDSLETKIIEFVKKQQK
jgi:hypothetical protein